MIATTEVAVGVWVSHVGNYDGTFKRDLIAKVSGIERDFAGAISRVQIFGSVWLDVRKVAVIDWIPCEALRWGSTRSKEGRGIRICERPAKFNVHTLRNNDREIEPCCGVHERQARRSPFFLYSESLPNRRESK